MGRYLNDKGVAVDFVLDLKSTLVQLASNLQKMYFELGISKVDFLAQFWFRHGNIERQR